MGAVDLCDGGALLVVLARHLGVAVRAPELALVGRVFIVFYRDPKPALAAVLAVAPYAVLTLIG